MGRLLRVSDYKNGDYSRAPLFYLNWPYANYVSSLSSADNNLLVNTNKAWHNSKVIKDNTTWNGLVRADTLSYKDTLLSYYIASPSENIGDLYSPKGFYYLKDPIVNTGRYLVLNGSYADNNSRVGRFDANKVYNYLNNWMYKATNGTITNSYTINLFMTECSLSVGTGYQLIPSNSPLLGVIVHAIYYDEADGDIWEYMYQDSSNNIALKLQLYMHESYVRTNCLYNIVSPSDLSHDISILPSNYNNYGYYFDKRLNNNSANLPPACTFTLGDFILIGLYNLLGLEFIISSTSMPKFSYYDSNNIYKTYDGPVSWTFSTPLLTPAICYHDLSYKDTTGEHQFNISPYVLDKGTINEVMGVRKKNTSGDAEYIIGTRHIYSLFYPIPLIGGNGNNKFDPTTELAITNNEIGAILHHYGNASNWDTLSY